MHLARVFLPFAIGYLLSYTFRVVNAVIAPELVRDVGLTAADLGLLTSGAFLAFAVLQLPVGLMLDRWGPRKTEAGLLLLAVAGSALTALADSLEWLLAGRLLIGAGTAACLMAAFKAATHWFSLARLPFVNGLTMASGGLGAMAGTVPIEWVLDLTDWRGLFWILGAVTAAVAALILLAVPPRDRLEHNESFGAQVAGLIKVFKSPFFWRLAPVTTAAQTTFLSIQGLWTGPWLADVAGLGRGAVVEALFLIALGMVAGFISFGWLTQRLARTGVPPMRVAAVGMGLFSLTLASLALDLMPSPVFGWVLFGYLGTAGIIPYSQMPGGFPPELTGRANTALNLLVFIGAFAGQWGIGEIINLWPPATVILGDGSEAVRFSAEGYRAAFLVMAALPALFLVQYLWSERRASEPDK